MKLRHWCVVGWFVLASMQWAVVKGAVPIPKVADFQGALASEAATEVANWVVQADDQQGQPFVVVDKTQARVFVFNADGHLLGATPALIGLAPGDEGLPGLGDRALSGIRPHERITPAGRFVGALSRNVVGQDILWVDYDQGISLHAVRSADVAERRLQRLASTTSDDNRISYGCINVPEKFWREVLVPAFTDAQGMVYVLPETRTWRSVFVP
jgi:hypothetical protein